MPRIDPPWPSILSGVPFLADLDFSRQRVRPRGVVIHSGDKAERVAESALHDRRDVSYHLCWSKTHQEYVQLVSLRDRAWHAGPRGNGWLGIALPGPASLNPRPPEQLEAFRAIMGKLVAAFGPGGLRYWCKHADLDPKKREPGPGFTAAWMVGFGLTWELP